MRNISYLWSLFYSFIDNLLKFAPQNGQKGHCNQAVSTGLKDRTQPAKA